MEMFSKKVPKTADNFLKICNGDNDANLTYKGNFFHRIIDNFMAQGGDITAQNGTGGKSIYGHKFPDEQVWYPHTHKGVMSMANSGPDTNGSQFFLNFAATPHLDGKHTVFGRVIDNYDFMHAVMLNPTGAQDKPLKQVTIVDCGELTGDQKLNKDNSNHLGFYTAEEKAEPEEESDDGEDGE